MLEKLEEILKTDAPLMRHIAPGVREMWNDTENLMKGDELANTQELIVKAVAKLYDGYDQAADENLSNVRKQHNGIKNNHLYL